MNARLALVKGKIMEIRVGVSHALSLALVLAHPKQRESVAFARELVGRANGKLHG
jgi:hypothetical protein